MISFFNLHTPHSIATKMMNFHLPDGRTTSPYYPPLLSPVFHWLVVVCVLVDWRPSTAIE